VAVPLDDVDLALVVIAQPIRGPGARGQAVELDACFPGMADTAPPAALDFAAIEGGPILRGLEDQVGFAVEEHVAAVVAILTDVLGQLPLRRVFDVLPRRGHGPLRPVRRRAGRAVEVIGEDIVARRSGWWTGIRPGRWDRGRRGQHAESRHQYQRATIHLRHRHSTIAAAPITDASGVAPRTRRGAHGAGSGR